MEITEVAGLRSFEGICVKMHEEGQEGKPEYNFNIIYYFKEWANYFRSERGA